MIDFFLFLWYFRRPPIYHINPKKSIGNTKKTQKQPKSSLRGFKTSDHSWISGTTDRPQKSQKWLRACAYFWEIVGK